MRIVREVLALAVLLVHFALVWFYWNSLPAQIPTHFGLSGAPDAYGSKSSLLDLPIIAAALYGLLTGLNFFPRRSFNYPVAVTAENRPRLEAITLALLGWIKVETVCLLAWLTWDTIRVALGQTGGLGVAFLPVFIIIFLATIVVGVVRIFRAR